MTRSKRFLAGAFLAAAVAVGTASPALANMHATGGTSTDNIHITGDSTDNIHITGGSTDNIHIT
ncbi:hypothetical protein ACFTUC_16470 [Streptomyces sp. NPDC056944]|uniref:hypothetical protein n=1 Tax=Streptomyces sp. NPDC056944 TaxID=3345972 RepID=UPI003644DB58